MTVTYQVELLDRWHLYADYTPISMRLREQRVLTLLALCGALPRRRLAGMLWPDTTDCRAADSLRVSLCHIHRAAPGLLECSDGWVDLAPDVQVDLRILRARLETLLGDPMGSPDTVELLTSIRELLPDWDEAWLQEEQDAVRQLQLQALEATAIHLLNSGQVRRAWNLAHQVLRLNPVSESAANIIARAEAGQGNHATAAAGLLHFITRLREELGVEPGPEIVRTLAALRGN